MHRKPNPFLAYALTLVVFGALDAVWLTQVAAPAFQAALGDTLLESPRFIAVGLFYLVYSAGVVYLAVLPGAGAAGAAIRGAVLGLVAYGTYDLSNLATLSAYTTNLAALDMAWGTVGTAITAGVVAALSGRFGRG